MDTVQYKGAASAPPPGFVPQPGYGQPPPQYVGQQPQITLVQAPALSLGLKPANIRCPNCQQQVITEVKRSNTSKTHLWMLGLCLCGCWPCCLIPYCCDACRGALHSCPSCKMDIGVGQGGTV